MVSFNRNFANDPLFPVPPSGDYRGHADSTGASQRGRDWLAEIDGAWHQLLSTVGGFRLSIISQIPSSRNVFCSQPDFSKIALSILNRFQLLLWMYESQAEKPDSSDSKDSFEERLVRILDSIQRDLIRLRKLVSESSFQSRLTHRTELTDHLERFFRRLQP